MTKESKYAIFKYKKSDEDLIDDLASYLDEHGHIPFDFFEVEAPKSKIVVDLISSKRELDEQYRKDCNLSASQDVGDFTAYFNQASGHIRYLSLNDFKNTKHAFSAQEYPKMLRWYKKTLVHEYVHYVNDLFRQKHGCSYTERYLEEGIAVYLSGEGEEFDNKFNFPVERLLEKGERRYYSAYYLITKYFVEHYDKNYVLEIFQSNRQARELLQNELYDRAKKFYTEEQNS